MSIVSNFPVITIVTITIGINIIITIAGVTSAILSDKYAVYSPFTAAVIFTSAWPEH